MKFTNVDYRLYLATDSALLGQRDLAQVVEEAILHGASIVQLRDKSCTAAALYEQAKIIHRITRRHEVPLIINDRLDVMLAVDAEGVHLGPHDLPAAAARRLAGKKIIGCSVNNMADLQCAESAGADYVGVGPAFGTATKADARTVLGIEGVRRLVQQAHIPCVAIGGITLDRVPALMHTGIAGVCVISALLKADDLGAAVQGFRRECETGGDLAA